MNIEKTLPEHERLDGYFGDYFDHVQADITALTERQNGNLLDAGLEFDLSSTTEYFMLSAQCLEKFAFEQSSADLEAALYCGLIFAFQVATIIHGDNTRINMPEYIVHLQAAKNCGEDCTEVLRNEVSEYLSENRSIDDLINFYVDDLDEGRGKHAAIELACGLCFMLVERSHGVEYAAAQSQNATVADFE